MRGSEPGTDFTARRIESVTSLHNPLLLTLSHTLTRSSLHLQLDQREAFPRDLVPGASRRPIEFDVAEDGPPTSLVRETESGELEECKVLVEQDVRTVPYEGPS